MIKKEYAKPAAQVLSLAAETSLLVGSISGTVSGPVGSNARSDESEWDSDDE